MESIDGDVWIEGTGGDGFDGANYGIEAGNNASVISTGTEPNAAKLTLIGTAGVGSSYNIGIGWEEGRIIIHRWKYLDRRNGEATVRVNGIRVCILGWDTPSILSTGVGPNAASFTIVGFGELGNVLQCWWEIGDGGIGERSNLDRRERWNWNGHRE